MTVNERAVWATLITFPLVGAVYFAVVLTRAAEMPVDEVSWVVPMIWAMGLLIGMVILGTIAASIATAIAAEARGETAELEEGDVRDKQIELLGDARAYQLSGFGGLAAIILLMVGAEPFWVANTLFLSGILTGMLAAGIKIRAYRNGL
ncbi:hypothetical protein [Demequina activiva]|uniref:DUF2178 domain-containing protein n=1 Tax=Demequina activiva TaxID=1582364 RepID=A0A919Q675_9MICO|nr:hypothetical protein [Demequina activiva]GIG55626.1 hypothetical protein Dac01nite_23780 [Demequina activiva]